MSKRVNKFIGRLKENQEQLARFERLEANKAFAELSIEEQAAAILRFGTVQAWYKYQMVELVKNVLDIVYEEPDE